MPEVFTLGCFAHFLAGCVTQTKATMNPVPNETIESRVDHVMILPLADFTISPTTSVDTGRRPSDKIGTSERKINPRYYFKRKLSRI